MRTRRIFTCITAILFVLVGVQSANAQHNIPTDGTIGTWDPVYRIYTLTKDVSGNIVIGQDNLTLDGNGHTVTGSGSGRGVELSGRTGVTIQNVTVEQFEYGIYLDDSSGNSLIGNIASNNNKTGIRLNNHSEDNFLDGNQADTNNERGIVIYNSNFNTLRNNTMSGNPHNFRAHVRMRQDIDTTNLVDGRPIYYILDAVGTTYDSSTNAGTFYAVYCEGITIKDLTLSNNSVGVTLWNTDNSTVENVTASNNGDGIVLFNKCSGNILVGNTTTNNHLSGIAVLTPACSDNTLTGNVCSSNNDGITLNVTEYNILSGNNCHSNDESGINVWNSVYNTVQNNTCRYNTQGIRLLDSGYNLIVNNNFSGNSTQALVDGGSGNVFNLAWPTGGNFWSDWTDPDADGDGIVDDPYIFTGGQDNMPWAQERGWIPAGIQQLIAQVEVLNLQQGINSSLDVKLDAAFQALDDINANNDVAAINALEAFINAVEAQRGKQITEMDADALIAMAEDIIAMLSP